VDETEMQRRAQLAEEMILTDERLRGGLTDEQFEQILGWALPLAQQAAAATAGIEDSAAAEAALDERLQQLRRHIREAVRLAEEAAAAMTEQPPGDQGGLEAPGRPDDHARRGDPGPGAS
jgi:hypothetical protein